MKGEVIMDAKKKRLMTVLLVVGFVSAGLLMLNGCKKEEPTPSPADTNEANSEMAMATEMATEIATTGEHRAFPLTMVRPHRFSNGSHS